MGLDFIVYKKKVNESTSEAWKVPDFEESRELAYGRKSWELVYALVPSFEETPDEDIPIVKASWNDLMEKIEPIADKLDAIIEAFDKENYAPEDYTEFIFGDNEKRLIAEFEYWYNRAFDTRPQLGYDFAACYIANFWKANDEVQKVFADPEWEVWASVSY